MNPYEILGVSTSATESEIKAAYRKLVKEYHPDRNHSDDAKRIISTINEAYYILSDPVKKASYDNYGSTETIQYVYEEDPREVYRREYLRKKSQKDREEREAQERLSKRVHKVFWGLSIPLILLSVILLIDYYIPPKVYHEKALQGWQQRFGGGRHSKGRLVSFMQTEHFILAVPSELHVDYDYYYNPAILNIEISPLLKIPKRVSVSLNSLIHTFVIEETIFSSGIILPMILLALSALSCAMYKFSNLSMTLAIFPLIMGIFVLFKIWG